MGYRDYVHDKMEKTTLDMEPDEWFWFQFKTATPLAIALAVSIFFLTGSLVLTLIGGIFSFLVLFTALIFALEYLAYVKAREVEDSLPDALELLASNLRAGLPLNEALQTLMREEFGPLAREMRTAVTEMQTGVSTREALRATTVHVDSPLYSKTIKTLTRAMDSGADLAAICSDLAENMTEMKNVRRQVQSSSLTYSMFLGFAALVAAPILFALSAFLVEASTEIFSTATAEAAASGPAGFLSFSTDLPPVGLLTNFFLFAIGTITFFTSLGIGIVREGSMRVGLRYVIPFMAVSYIFFFTARTFIQAIVGISI